MHSTSISKPLLNCIATTNPGKLKEFEGLLGYPVVSVALNIPELQPSDAHLKQMEAGQYADVARAIAADKARAAYNLNNWQPVIVEDTSLFVASLPRITGPLIKFWCDKTGLERLCRDVHQPIDGGATNARAVAIVVLAAWNGRGEPQTWIGITEGTIASAPRGDKGFGWDPIFIPDGQGDSPKTFAEMDSETKALFSMRRRAVEEFKKSSFKNQ